MNGRVKAGRRAHAGNGGGSAPYAGDSRERLLGSVLSLAVREDYHALSVPQIFEEAGATIEEFFELFASKDECFLAAFDDLSDELLQIAADPDLVSAQWSSAVRRVIAELMGRLAARPSYAHAIATVAPSAGPDALARDIELVHSIATLLTEGAPVKARNRLAVEAIAGAIWHTIRCQVSSDQIHLLPALADYLAYVVLTPFTGADTAAEIVIEDQPAPVAAAPVPS